MRTPGPRREPDTGMPSHSTRPTPDVRYGAASDTRSKLARAQNGVTARRDGFTEQRSTESGK